MKQQGHTLAPKELASYDIQYTPNQSDLSLCLPWIQWIQVGAHSTWTTFFFCKQFVKLNFSHNGTSPTHPLDFVDLEALLITET
jgi:hypothetical protein